MNFPQRALSSRLATESVQVKNIMTLKRRPVFPEAGVGYREIGIRSFGRGVFHKEPVTGDDIGDKRVFSIEPGDLLFSNVFAWEGAVALAGVAESGMIGSHRFMTYVVNDSLAHAGYLKHYFTSEAGLEIIRRASPGSAGRNRTLGIKAFDEQWLQLPDLPEQRRIAARLDASILKLGRVNSKVAESTTLRDALLESAIDAEEDQVKVRLGDVLALERISIDPVPDQYYVQIGIRSFGKGIFRRDKVPGNELSKLRYFEVHPDRLIVSNIMAWEGAIAVSAESEVGCVGSSRFLSYARSGDVDLRYLNYYFRSKAGRALIRSTSTGTVLRNQTLSIKDFDNLNVPLPSVERQHKVADMLDTANRIDKLSAQQAATTKEIREALLNAAIGGEL
jgi:type I restriction enzyme S subunit